MRLYDRLFTVENPGADDTKDWLDELNPHALTTLQAKGEPLLADAKAGDRFQFERVGFFYADPDTTAGKPVFNRTVPLKDGWAKLAARTGAHVTLVTDKGPGGNAATACTPPVMERLAKEVDLVLTGSAD